MYIFLIILSILSVIVAEYIATAFIGFSILNLSFWVVIPAGGALIGMFLGWTFSNAFRKCNKKFSKWHCLMAAVVSILTFIGINYMEYRTTYLLDDYTISRTFEGAPISEFVYTDDDGIEKQMTFINYQKYLLDNSDSTIRFKSGDTVDVKTSGKINYIVYFLQLIAMIIFTTFYFVINLSDFKYCDNCKRYYTAKKLFEFLPSDYDIVMNKLNDVNGCLLDLKELCNNNKKIHNNVYFKAILMYCKECKNGEIIIKKHKGNDTDNIKNIALDSFSVESLI